MTDQQRIDKAYEKVRVKNPAVTDQNEIIELAVRQEKRSLVLAGLGWLGGAVLSVLLFCLLWGNETFTETRFLMLVTTGTCVFEAIRKLICIGKVESLFRPKVQTHFAGQLTPEVILRDGKLKLMKHSNQFMLSEARLCDKEDEMDTLTGTNIGYHTYRLQFELGDAAPPLSFKVSGDVYEEAVIGTFYLLALTPNNEVAAAYPTHNWSISPELQPYIRRWSSQQDNTP